MKKLISLFVVLVMAFAFAACGKPADTPADPSAAPVTEAPATEAPADPTEAPATEAPTEEAVESGYPSDPSAWTSDDLIKYFKDAGVFENEDWLAVQDHPTYYPNMGINECVSYMDNDGLVLISIFNTDPENGDADVEAYLAGVRETHALPADLGSVPVDHMVGDLVFWYSFTADEEVYNKMDAAYNQFITEFGFTPEF